MNNTAKFVTNKIIKVNDKSNYNDNILALELFYQKDDKIYNKCIYGKLYSGKMGKKQLNSKTALFNLLNNFRKKFPCTEEILTKDKKLNKFLYKQLEDKDMTVLAYQSDNIYKYYDWFIGFDKFDVKEIIRQFNIGVNKNKINFNQVKLEKSNERM